MVDIHEHINLTRQTEKTAMIRATISRKFEGLISNYPKIPVAQLIAYIYRSKGEVQGQPWNWGDERLLKKIELIERDLSTDYNSVTGEFNDELASDELIIEVLSNINQKSHGIE